MSDSENTATSPDQPDDEGSPANLVRSAFIAGMDRCREVYEAYGEWPSLPGRVDLAEDYLSTLVLLGPESVDQRSGRAASDLAQRCTCPPSVPLAFTASGASVPPCPVHDGGRA